MNVGGESGDDSTAKSTAFGINGWMEKGENQGQRPKSYRGDHLKVGPRDTTAEVELVPGRFRQGQISTFDNQQA